MLPRPLTPPPAAPDHFFDHIKRALDDRDAWEEFLKLLNLYSTDVIDENLLVQLAAPFLGGVGSELEVQFRDMMGVEKRKGKKEKEREREIMLQREKERGYNGSNYLNNSKSRFGPSYRRLPESVSGFFLLLPSCVTNCY